MDTRILDVSIAHGCKFFAQICAVLVFDIFNNGIPAFFKSKWEYFWLVQRSWDAPSFVVDLVAVSRSVNYVESKSNAVLDNDCKAYVSIKLPLKDSKKEVPKHKKRGHQKQVPQQSTHSHSHCSGRNKTYHATQPVFQWFSLLLLPTRVGLWSQSGAKQKWC